MTNDTRTGHPIEAEMVFDREGNPLLYRSGEEDYIADAHEWWKMVWNIRHQVGGIAHVHPWHGQSIASQTDFNTFEGWENAIGRRLLWCVVSFTHETYYQWNGVLHNHVDKPPFVVQDVETLRNMARRTP